MALKKVLISVKTYPTIYVEQAEEIVCTAGFDEDGNWVRIFPIPFRQLEYKNQYAKYQWIEIDLEKNTKDFRPETFKPRDIEKSDFIKILDKVDTKNNWQVRKNFVLKNVFNDITKLIDEAKSDNKYTSLAVFKPTEILDFIKVPALRDWNDKQKAALLQYNIFEKKNGSEVVKKLPFKFSYVFKDINGRECTLMNEDWELGALFWNCLKKNNGDEDAAWLDVKKKYYDDFALTKDLYFFLGTTKLHHLRAPNPFIIIGTFHPKKEDQYKLDFSS